MFVLERCECCDDAVRVITDRPIAADQVRIGVCQSGVPTLEPPGGMEVEEDRAATGERLAVPIEVGRIVTTEGGE
jgi:hypothetical protein